MAGIAQMFLGGGSPGVIQTIQGGTAGGGTCTFVLKNDGTYTMSGTAGGNWVSPAAAVVAAQWSVRVTNVSGTLNTGTVGSWLALSSNRTWTETGEDTTISVEFRDTSETIRSTQSVDMFTT